MLPLLGTVGRSRYMHVHVCTGIVGVIVSLCVVLVKVVKHTVFNILVKVVNVTGLTLTAR